MKIGKKILSLFMAAVTAVGALSVTAFAADPIGTNPTVLKDGVQVTEQIPYDDSRDFDNGHNYMDFIFTAPTDGVMVITYDVAINNSRLAVYRKDTSAQLSMSGGTTTSGDSSDYGWEGYKWNGTTGIYARTAEYKVEKGDYLIRVSRFFDKSIVGLHWEAGTKGNGRVHIKAEMKKPDAPASIKVSKKTDTTFTLTWSEPNEATAYDLRYKASGDSAWKTVNNIKDNTYTVKGLKAKTKYTYCIRTKAGELAGEWSKSAAVTTDDPKNVTFTAPTVDSTITITWKEVANATGYNVKYSTDNKTWKTVSVTGTSYALKVTSGKKYYYAVQAKNSAKKGPWSKTKSITIG